METVVAEFAKVLDVERAFALKADVDGLGAIQAEKRELLDKLLASGATEAETAPLRERAMANVQLIRHLVACLQGISQPAGPTYDSGGGRSMRPVSRSWGRL
ncbi:MAG TPA: hypothetical protein VI299_27555 [Polyangiales bacterium]